MSEVVNLNQARKVRARDEARAAAAQNRVRFGQPKADRTRDTALQAKADQALDGKKREP